jgi:hypothetical protein
LKQVAEGVLLSIMDFTPKTWMVSLPKEMKGKKNEMNPNPEDVSVQP